MQAISTKYLPATNFRGSRIKAWIVGGKALTMPYDDSLSSERGHAVVALTLASNLGWQGEYVCGEVKGGYVFVPTRGVKKYAAY